MIKVIAAILVFGIVIAIHEFGHFIVAKKGGIQVNKFAIGMGPAILKKQIGETEYSLRLLPIGGFCAMEGEDEDSDNERAFNKRPVGIRIAVVAAGAIMNLILGLLIVLVMTCMEENITSTTVSKFRDNASSAATGLQAGDKILKIDGMTVFTDFDISYKLGSTTNESYDLLVLRDGEKVKLPDVVFYDAAAGSVFDFYVYPAEKTFFNVISYSCKKAVSIARLIWISLIDLLSGKYGVKDLSGPVGIVTEISSVPKLTADYLLSIMSFITINLGIFNLLPFPALDGGRLVFLIIEAIRHKPIKVEYEAMVHFIGIVLLMILMAVVTFNDILKLF